MEKKKTEKNELVTIKMLLWIILGVLLVNTCFVIFEPSTTTKKSEETDTETDDYDVSSFNAIDEKGFMSTIKKSDIQVIYLGRETCGYCVQFLPTMKEASTKLKFTTNYVDITKVDSTSEEYTKMTTMINDMTDSFNKKNDLSGDNAYKYLYGYTPMVVLAKDGKIIDVWVGYSSYDTYAKWLTDNGVK